MRRTAVTVAAHVVAAVALATAAMAGAGAGAGAGKASRHIRDPLVGTWVLDRAIDIPAHGATLTPYGQAPNGMFVFTADGHFSFSMMRMPATDDPVAAGPYRDIVPNWYLSYFGRYRYDPAGPRWVAEVTGGNVPTFIGTTQRRDFVIRGDTLKVWSRYTVAGESYYAERTLHRAR